MQSFTRFGIFAILTGVVAMGCGTQPIPLIAVTGTTITIPVPGSFPVGFGRAFVTDLNAGMPAYAPDSPLEDPQRGELWFSLWTDTEPPVFVGLMSTRYITRLQIDPATPAAVGPGAGINAFNREGGQALAFVDVPVNDPGGAAIVTGDYIIQVRRLLRDPANPDRNYSHQPAYTDYLGIEWLGWGNPNGVTADVGIPIRIIEGDGQEHFTPLHGYTDVWGFALWHGDITYYLESSVPYPSFVMRVPTLEDLQSTPPPAAWEAELSYPKDILRIRAVYAARVDRGSSFVDWEADDPNAIVACGDANGTLKIRMIDPQATTQGVRIVFQLRNFENDCGAQAVPEDFVVESFNAYDETGAEMTVSREIRYDRTGV
jgi:hypothetical protein